jgi:hypothetical protein
MSVNVNYEDRKMVIRPEGPVKLKIFLIEDRPTCERSFAHPAPHIAEKGWSPCQGKPTSTLVAHNEPRTWVVRQARKARSGRRRV